MSADKTTDPVTALSLLDTYNQDAKTRNEKYKKRMDDGRRGLAKRLCFAIQEITNRGQYMIRFENFYLVRTIVYEVTHFDVSMVNKNEQAVNLDSLEYGEMIRLAEKLTNGEYTLMSYEQDEFYLKYRNEVFPLEDEVLTIAEKEVAKFRKDFEDSFAELLYDLKKLGLCLKLKPIWSSGSNYTVVTGNSSSTGITFYTDSKQAAHATIHLIAETRKQIRANEIQIAPFDQAFK